MTLNRTNRMQQGAAVLTVLLVLGISQVAFGQEGRRGRGRTLSPERQKELIQQYPDIDTDGDGAVSPDEARTFFRSRDRGPDDDRDRSRGDRGDRGDRGERRDRGDRGGPPRGDWGGRRGDFERRAREILERHPEADKNGDGRVSPDEARAFFEANPQVMREEFLRRNPELDTDKDGKLSDEEMRAARTRFDERRREEMLRRNPELDTDKDGKLSEEEMQAARAQFAERFRQDMLRRNPEADKDGDGKLSEEEMDALRQSFRSRWGGRSGPDGRRSDGPQEAQGGQGPGPDPGSRTERRDPRASLLGRTERDPWTQYVAEFSARYKLDASQQNSAMSILKDYAARRAKLQAGQDAASIAEKKKAEDALFKEMKERLDQIPTTAQRNAVPAQVQTPTSKPA